MELRKAYREQLKTLQDELAQMGNLCVQAMDQAIRAVTSGEETYAERARETDEVIDQAEKDIESLCLALLLQQQPVASDMRRISSALKMIDDLIRIGDQAADIAELAGYITIREGAAADDISAMAGAVMKMVTESIQAFNKNDLVLAREVVTRDDEADEWFMRTKSDLIKQITADNTQGEYCLDVLMVAKYLERIGDHASNVAEWVEYSILGHHSGEDPA